MGCTAGGGGCGGAEEIGAGLAPGCAMGAGGVGVELVVPGLVPGGGGPERRPKATGDPPPMEPVEPGR